MPKTIKIVTGHPPAAVPDEQLVSKEKGEHVEWESDSKDWAVVFDRERPFERHYFNPSHAENKEIVVESDSNRRYKYTVYLNGKKGADPIIVVT